MNRPTHALLALLRAGIGINNTLPSRDDLFPLTPIEWREVQVLAQRQTVSGFTFAGLERLADDLMPPDELVLRWVAKVDQIEKNYKLITLAQSSLLHALRERGVRPVVQKGLSVARYYPEPELRECGDIDICLPEAEIAAAVEFARSLGQSVEIHADGSRSFAFRGFLVELHSRLIGLSAPGARRRLAAIVDRHAADPRLSADLPAPAPLLELLLLDVHIMRHAFGTGIGLRQICDYVCAASSLRGHYDPAEFARACADLGIARWTALLNAFAVRYLGADPDALAPSGYKSDSNLPVSTLMDIIIAGGNFGRHPGATAAHVSGSKLHTLAMLLRRARFSLSLAPAEATWNLLRLAAGQLRR